ncbi:hypothetical protein NIG5292_02443 [Nereida ignava]|uniref:Uncharacterized protein n=1 Tax=Nereida ignava TaxID=282199 RepID=A0A0U1NNS3_9RHOB|nr:hypothetical protein NIG5292_02443 [Nereida ignava]SFJ78627.1 hypothetical protein SAMN02745667_02355 [Nereida ignava DSM 16309]
MGGGGGGRTRPSSEIHAAGHRWAVTSPNRPFETSCSNFGWVRVGASVPDGLLLPILREPSGLRADLVREVLGQDHVTKTDVPLGARIVLPHNEGHDDDRAVDLFRGRIVAHPGLSEVVKLSECLFRGDAWAVYQGLIPRPGVMCAAVADVVERCDP